ncbi:DegV family protein [Desemzia sp. RIT804]|uniref:DegV family protein n=1 Tax=Desemzia sp. RIT 804 TaxID=2810209 RepID=UPI00195051F4|nr:DegV family protein [Desemzia sp. RIT 804]MBM6613643.1 DegV family protein [Desemzia sp. RIT 804]
MSYKLITDSCCDLPYTFIEEQDIDIVSLTVHMNGNELIDDMGKTFDRNQFFQELKNGAMATTSQINIGTYIDVFEKYVKEGMPILYIAFSSALSGSYNNAVAAVEQLKEDYPTVNITIVDSKAACLGEGLLVYEAAMRKSAGATLEEVATWLEENKMKVHSWVTVDDIKHLERGGRVSALSATLGTLLNVKPIIIVNPEGGLVPTGKVRGRKKSLHYLVNKTVEGIVDPEQQTLFIGHVGVPEEAEMVKQELLDQINVKDIKISPYGPTIAAHTGFGSLSIFSMGEERT